MIGQNKPLEIDYSDYSSEESFYFIARILTSLTTLMLLEMSGITVFVFSLRNSTCGLYSRLTNFVSIIQRFTSCI